MFSKKTPPFSLFSTPIRALALPVLVSSLMVIAGCSTSNGSGRAVSTLCAQDASLKDYNQRTLLGAGYEAMQQSDLNCAERLLAQAHKLDPKDPWALLNLGVARYRMGKLDEARVAYQMAAAVDPKTSGIELKASAISEQQRETAVVSTQTGALNQSAGQIALQNLKLVR